MDKNLPSPLPMSMIRSHLTQGYTVNCGGTLLSWLRVVQIHLGQHAHCTIVTDCEFWSVSYPCQRPYLLISREQNTPFTQLCTCSYSFHEHVQTLYRRHLWLPLEKPTWRPKLHRSRTIWPRVGPLYHLSNSMARLALKSFSLNSSPIPHRAMVLKPCKPFRLCGSQFAQRSLEYWQEWLSYTAILGHLMIPEH